MKSWALVVAGLYLLALVVLTVPVILAALVPGHEPMFKPAEVVQTYTAWQYWLWVGVMVLCQAALLATPVALANRRPVTHRSLWLPVATTGLMMGALIFGALLSLNELVLAQDGFLFRDGARGWVPWGPLFMGLLTWCIWSVVFFRMYRKADVGDAITRQCELLLKGSILELLIAVPTHIVARSREYCCAGLMTFIGLTMGISVMLFSFGPAVFFLYVARWRLLHPE